MESIIVEVFVPATSEHFDFRLPASACVGDVVKELIDVFSATRQNMQFDSAQPMLCDVEHSAILDPKLTVACAGLCDGSRLMLL